MFTVCMCACVCACVCVCVCVRVCACVTFRATVLRTDLHQMQNNVQPMNSYLDVACSTNAFIKGRFLLIHVKNTLKTKRAGLRDGQTPVESTVHRRRALRRRRISLRSQRIGYESKRRFGFQCVYCRRILFRFLQGCDATISNHDVYEKPKQRHNR